MSDLDYGLLRRRVLPAANSLTTSLLISSFNDSDRVREVFGQVAAARRCWVVHPEYGYRDDQFPSNADLFVVGEDIDELEMWNSLFEFLGEPSPDRDDLTIDITGMLRPHLMVMPIFLRGRGFERVRVLYSDPVGYQLGAGTAFSKSEVQEVRQVRGFEGIHNGGTELLVIGGGYDARLVQRIAESREDAEHFLLLGLPSLEAHMYQESRFQMAKAGDWLSRFGRDSYLYAPAADPFMTAQSLQSFFERRVENAESGNLYLAPVGSKTQALGFAWFASCEGANQPISVVFPFTERYSERTSYGTARVHEFELELDWIPPRS